MQLVVLYPLAEIRMAFPEKDTIWMGEYFDLNPEYVIQQVQAADSIGANHRHAIRDPDFWTHPL